MISPLRILASSNASLLFPAPVGPEMTMTLSLFLIGCAEEQNVDKREARRMLTSGRMNGSAK